LAARTSRSKLHSSREILASRVHGKRNPRLCHGSSVHPAWTSLTHGRGMDLSPNSVTAQLVESLVPELDSDELWRALSVTVRGLLAEVDLSDEDFGTRIAASLTEVSSKPI
jgi:hypothetical protein